uniref:Putative ovule protein n=1 Tax=Solanum chacoense TaxID=4108 RepID=A0A0V0IKA3_SOLCH
MRFFHSIVKGRRKKLQLHRIQNNQGNWLEEEEEIAAEAVNFYHSQFLQERDATEFSLLGNIPEIISEADNAILCRQPTLEEIKRAVFNLNGVSTSGPDGLSGAFYQCCWDIVGTDIFRMVQEFFRGNSLPRFITLTNLVLLPKKEHIQSFDLRPISLSNFTNKILSRVVHDRLEAYLSKLISHNQSGFVKGRSIIENVLLTQEIVSDIRKRGR